MRKCKRKDCRRLARDGWTHCSRHYSAGDSVVNDLAKHKTKKPSLHTIDRILRAVGMKRSAPLLAVAVEAQQLGYRMVIRPIKRKRIKR